MVTQLAVLAQAREKAKIVIAERAKMNAQAKKDEAEPVSEEASPHAGTHENHNGIYVASQVLGNDTMVARSVDDTTMVAHSSDVLQFINNDVPLGGLRGWEFCPFSPFFAIFFTFTKISQVPSFQAHSPVKTVFRQNPKNARKSQNTPSTYRYQNETQLPLSRGHPDTPDHPKLRFALP